MELVHIATRYCKLLSVLRRELRLSSTLVGRLKRESALFVEGLPAFTDHPVRPGDRITVRLEEAPPDFPTQHSPLSILYEDDGLICLDKPPKLLLHPTAHRQTGTLANFLAGYYAETGQRCGIHPVSRLDRDTFGVCLFAKNAHLHALCTGHFDKIYHATVFGRPPGDRGEITLPIARRENSLWREVGTDGQNATTQYQVLRRAGGLSLLELRPVTGRTHQLRVHCQAAGFPILGDPVYHTAQSAARSDLLGLFHQQLLANSIAFSHPLTNVAVQITSRQAVFWP